MQSISVLLFENFSNHCLANAVEPFRAANTISRKNLYAWQFFSIAGGTVRSSSGLQVETLKWSDHDPRGDFLFVMPSYGFLNLATASTHRLLRAARTRFRTLVGLDTGAWLLASAGLLDNRNATIHWDEFTRFAEQFPDTNACEDRYVIDPDLATCGGASTAIELSLRLISLAHSPVFALEVAALFMHGDRMELQDPFQRMAAPELVRSVTTLMRRRIEEPLSIPELAREMHATSRQLAEAFQAHLHVSPRAAYKSIRLREARRLVELTTLRMTEIAARCGYRDASALTRAYRSEFGHTPRQHRAHAPIARN